MASGAKFAVYQLDSKVATLIRDCVVDQHRFDESYTWFQNDDGTLDMKKWEDIDETQQRAYFADYVLDKAVPHTQKDLVTVLDYECSSERLEYHLRMRRGANGKETFEDKIASWLRDDDDGLGIPKVKEKSINFGFTSLPYPFFYVFVLNNEGWTIIQSLAETTGDDDDDTDSTGSDED